MIDFEDLRDRLVGSGIEYYEPETSVPTLWVELSDDALVELREGQIVCQFGLNLEVLREQLSEGSIDALSEEDLLRVARGEVGARIESYRPALLARGFSEQEEILEDSYSVTFFRNFPEQPGELIELVRWLKEQLGNPNR